MDAQQAKQQAVEKIKAANNVLVSVSTNPSVDQLAAALGLTFMLNKLGKHASAVFSGDIPPAMNFLDPDKTFDGSVDALRDFVVSLDKEKADKLRYKVEDDVVKIFITPYKTKLSQDDFSFSQGDFNVDVVVALGVHKREDLDAAVKAHGRILHDATVITINAGSQNSEVGSVNWQNESASSLSEMLVSVSEAFKGGLLDAQISTAFLTGIVAATDRFRNAQTSPKVMTMAAQLMAAGANQQLIASNLAQSQTPVITKDEPAIEVTPEDVTKDEAPAKDPTEVSLHEDPVPDADEDQSLAELQKALTDDVDVPEKPASDAGADYPDKGNSSDNETILSAAKDPDVLDVADEGDEKKPVTISNIEDSLTDLKNELKGLPDDEPAGYKADSSAVEIPLNNEPPKDLDESLKDILPEVQAQSMPTPPPAPVIEEEVSSSIPDLNEVAAELKNVTAPSQQPQLPQQQPAQQLSPSVSAAAPPMSQDQQQPFQNITPSTGPLLPDQQAPTSAISSAKGVGITEMNDRPQMGGTFNATVTQQELVKEQERAQNRNNAILSHNMPKGLEVPEQNKPQVPVEQMSTTEVSNELNNQAADIEAARKAVQEAAGAVYSPAANSNQAPMPPAPQQMQQPPPMPMPMPQQQMPQPPQFNQPPQQQFASPMPQPPQFQQQQQQQMPQPPQFQQQQMPQPPQGMQAGPPPPPPPPLSAGAPPNAPRISPANLGSFAPAPPQQQGRTTSYISTAPSPPQNPLQQPQQRGY